MKMVSLTKMAMVSASLLMLISCGANEKKGAKAGEAAAEENQSVDQAEQDMLDVNDAELSPEDYAVEAAGKPKPPKYERITIPLPTPPGVPVQLPPSISFDVSNSFTAAEKQRIRDTIVRVIIAWNQHYVEKAASGASRLQACSLKYAKANLSPVWWPKKNPKILDGSKGAEVAMNELSALFADNGNVKKPLVAKIEYKIPSGKTNSTIFGADGSAERCTSLDVTINPKKMADLAITDLNLAGSLLHAWLHRGGYRHPAKTYTTYLIAESPMCVMRGYQDKVPGQSDSLYTQYFD